LRGLSPHLIRIAIILLSRLPVFIIAIGIHKVMKNRLRRGSLVGIRHRKPTAFSIRTKDTKPSQALGFIRISGMSIARQLKQDRASFNLEC